MQTDGASTQHPRHTAHARTCQQFEELLATLSSEEVLWVSGYLAGFTRQLRQPVAVHRRLPLQLTRLTILYGSQTGHAAELAKHMAKLAQQNGLAARAVDMAVFRPPGAEAGAASGCAGEHLWRRQAARSRGQLL